MVEMGHVIRQVTCGGLHTAVVTEEGKVFTWGDGRRGELGHIHDPSLKQTPRMVEMLDHVFVTSVACGGSHTVAITDSGQLYSWGWSRYGQTGHGERANVKFPKRIDHPLVKDIVQVACGSKHTMAITRSGTVIAFGANRHGQCGLSDFEDRLEPNRIESLRDTPISYVSCGAIHSCLVTTTGDVYICGFGEYFIPDESQHFFPEPRRVQLPEAIRSISCGQAHNLALSVNNNVYAFGSGEFGSLGYGVKANSATPRLVLDTKNIRQVAAGRYHSFALTDSGILYSWGCGENGQLLNNSRSRTEIKLIFKFQSPTNLVSLLFCLFFLPLSPCCRSIGSQLRRECAPSDGCDSNSWYGRRSSCVWRTSHRHIDIGAMDETVGRRARVATRGEGRT